VHDLGYLDVPILLTNTLNVGKVSDAAVSWLVERHPQMGVTDDVPLPVVAECDDSTLNDIQGRHVGEAQVRAALDGAQAGPVEEGAVGAGTGMMAYGFKAGIGTSSRHLPAEEGGYTVGVLVNSNMGIRRDMRVDGVPVGRELPENDLLRHTEGSIITVVGTDAPLSSRQLERVARRAALGLTRTGAIGHHGSGDLVLAFSTKNAQPREAQGFATPGETLRDDCLDPLYEATVDATEEAILNSILKAETTVGRDGNTAAEVPLDRLREVMARHGHPLQ
jgi:D-aminopeptidase